MTVIVMDSRQEESETLEGFHLDRTEQHAEWVRDEIAPLLWGASAEAARKLHASETFVSQQWRDRLERLAMNELWQIAEEMDSTVGGVYIFATHNAEWLED